MSDRRRPAVAILGVLAFLWLSAPWAAAAAAAAAEIRLRDVASAWGIDFTHHDGASGRRYLPETMGSGVLLFDYDEDGDPDVLLVDGGRLPGSTDAPFGTRLYRNDGGRFVDRTAAAGLQPDGFGAGATAGDVDGDGDLDVHLTAYGGGGLWINQGNGTFDPAGAPAGAAGGWGTSAAFADPDRDGDLDLYVAHYVDFAPAERTPCRQQGVEVYCHPGQYDGLPDRFFRNLGDGRFAEAGAEVGLAVDARAGLGVVFADFDGDAWPDLYVANDAEGNYLFLNRGDGTFEETALLAGTAYGDTGRPEAGMGVAVGDLSGSGRADIFVTNFELETNALYRNTGDGLFVDSRFASNVAEASLLSLAFGVESADLDHDGDLDLIIANGHILDNASEFHPRSSYAQRNQVFENLGAGRFRETVDFGVDAARVSRGLATADLDGDGDLDVVVNNVGDRSEVYENLAASAAWLVVDPRGSGAKAHAVGARVSVSHAGGQAWREIRAGSSYLSQSAMAAHFGLGDARRVERLDVSWPDGRRQRWLDLPVARRLRLINSR